MKCPKCHSEISSDTRFCSNCGAALPYEDVSVFHTYGFECLDRAYEGRDIWLPGIKTDHAFDNICSDPRYKALIKKMGLEK